VITVLHVITSIEPGGAEHHLLSLAKAQVESGDQVLVAYMRNTLRNLEGQFKDAGVTLFPMGLTWYGQLSPVLSLRSLIQSKNPNVVHAHLPPAELYTRIAMLGVNGNAFIISKHNDERFAPVPLSANLARWVAKRAAAVICISHAVEKFWQQKKVISETRSSVVHYGITQMAQTTEDTFKDMLSIKSNDVLFGFVGRLVPQKSLDSLLRAFSLLAVSNARLVIVGDGPLRAKLQDIAIELEISNQVAFTGYRSDIQKVMTGLDVFVLSSNYEGFGLVLLEAMRAGKPVLATEVSAIPEVVDNETTGILVPPKNPEMMAKAMKRFMTKETRWRMGNAGKIRAREQFGMSRMVKETQEVYERALDLCAA